MLAGMVTLKTCVAGQVAVPPVPMPAQPFPESEVSLTEELTGLTPVGEVFESTKNSWLAAGQD